MSERGTNSGRERADEALVESERRLTEVFEAAPAFMAVLRGPQMVFEKVNAAYLSLFGGCRAQPLGRPLLEVFPEVADQPFPAIVGEVMESGEAFRGSSTRVLVKRSDDGPLEERWVDFVYQPLRDPDGSISQVLVHGLDLTERVVAERSLRESRATLEFTLESAQIGDWDLDLATDTSRRSLRHDRCFGYATAIPDEWGFETFIRHVHPDDRAEVAREFHAALSTPKAWDFECRVVWPDGSIHWIAAHGSLYLAGGNEGKPTRMLGTVVDITERKHSEEIIRRSVDDMRNLNAELSEAARQKDEFIATLAHELRNPLAPISNALQVLRLADHKPEVAQAVFPVMERQVSQLVRLVDDLLDVNRISRGRLDLRRERIDLATAIEDAIDASRPLIERMQHTVTVALPPEPVYVHADPTRLGQILGNLLTNASKFTDPRGRIAVSVQRDARDAVIRVTDNGIGIAADQLGRVFEPFTQIDTSLERSVSGLGIGLSLAKSLVERHGGAVEVESPGLGQGSQFTVRLPLQD